jgi:hypothetical protein
MIIKNEIPDKEIRLSHGDKVNIYIRKNEISFEFFCDGTGNAFTLTRKELMEMFK